MILLDVFFALNAFAECHRQVEAKLEKRYTTRVASCYEEKKGWSAQWRYACSLYPEECAPPAAGCEWARPTLKKKFWVSFSNRNNCSIKKIN